MQGQDESSDDLTQGEKEDSSPSVAAAADTHADVPQQAAPVPTSAQQSEMSQPVQEAEAGSVADVLAKLSEGKAEAAPGQTHAEVLMAEQAQTVEEVQQSLGDVPDSSAVDGQPEGLVIQLDQHEPTAEEDVSQHMQLEQIQDVDAGSNADQPVQPDTEVDNAVAGDDAATAAADGTQTGLHAEV